MIARRNLGNVEPGLTRGLEAKYDGQARSFGKPRDTRAAAPRSWRLTDGSRDGHSISGSSHEALQIADCRLQIGAGVAR